MLMKASAVLMTVLITYQLPYAIRVDHNHQTEFPTSSLDYLTETYAGGNVFNVYHIGGYLLHQLPETFKIYIDGRTNILYPEAFYLEYLKAVRGNSEAVQAINEKYTIDFALWPLAKSMNFLLSRRTSLKAEYIGERNILYSRSGELQPIADALAVPACGRLLPIKSIKDTHGKIAKQSPPNKALLATLDIIIREDFSEKRTSEFLSEYSTSIQNNYDAYYRLLAYSAMEKKAYSVAALFFESVNNKLTLDAIHGVQAYLASERPDNSRSLLVQLMSGMWETSWPDQPINSQQSSHIYSLYRQLRNVGGSNEATDVVAQAFASEHDIEPENIAHHNTVDLLPSNSECTGLLSD